MRHALAILKYLPAVLCGLLVVAFVLSQFRSYHATFPLGRGWVFAELGGGTLGEQWMAGRSPTNRLMVEGVRSSNSFSLGRLHISEPSIWIKVPLLGALTLLLPLAIGPFIRFRFPRWSWFVFTALVAVELAYYLR